MDENMDGLAELKEKVDGLVGMNSEIRGLRVHDGGTDGNFRYDSPTGVALFEIEFYNVISLPANRIQWKVGGMSGALPGMWKKLMEMNR